MSFRLLLLARTNHELKTQGVFRQKGMACDTAALHMALAPAVQGKV
jgi:hypothetical protein